MFKAKTPLNKVTRLYLRFSAVNINESRYKLSGLTPYHSNKTNLFQKILRKDKY